MAEAPARSVTAMVREGGLTESLTLPAADLPAGTTQTATVVLKNTSSTNAPVTKAALVILDSKGRVAFSTEPTSPRFVSADVVLRPGETRETALPFVVPPPGAYTVLANGGRERRPSLSIKSH